MNLKFLFSIIIGILIGLGIIGVAIFIKNSYSKYYAVFLNNGSIYFGKLSTFPRLKLDDAIYLVFDQQGQGSLLRFKDSLWQPKGPIYFNKDAILFIAPIDEKSNIVRLIEGQSLSIPQQPQQNQPTQSQQQQNQPQQPQQQQPQ